jgi:hypothetical protein
MTARNQWYCSLMGIMRNSFSKILLDFVHFRTLSYAGQYSSVIFCLSC